MRRSASLLKVAAKDVLIFAICSGAYAGLNAQPHAGRGWTHDERSEYSRARQTVALKPEEALDTDVETLTRRATRYVAGGDYASAERLFKRALTIVQEKSGPNHPNAARAMSNLGMMYVADGKYDKAEPLLRQSLDIWQNKFGPYHPDVASSLHNLGTFYVAQKNYQQAESVLTRATAAWEKIGDASKQAGSLKNLSILYARMGRTNDAERAARAAAALSQKAGVQDSGSLGILLPR